ncbi:MAG: hypothetical protein LBF72_01055 [Holosporales bacterium]|jgi:hypothetical protein|nr:hypothetical protein [Holosporales bacterium]
MEYHGAFLSFIFLFLFVMCCVHIAEMLERKVYSLIISRRTKIKLPSRRGPSYYASFCVLWPFMKILREIRSYKENRALGRSVLNVLKLGNVATNQQSFGGWVYCFCTIRFIFSFAPWLFIPVLGQLPPLLSDKGLIYVSLFLQTQILLDIAIIWIVQRDFFGTNIYKHIVSYLLSVFFLLIATSAIIISFQTTNLLTIHYSQISPLDLFSLFALLLFTLCKNALSIFNFTKRSGAMNSYNFYNNFEGKMETHGFLAERTQKQQAKFSHLPFMRGIRQRTAQQFSPGSGCSSPLFLHDVAQIMKFIFLIDTLFCCALIASIFAPRAFLDLSPSVFFPIQMQLPAKRVFTLFVNNLFNTSLFAIEFFVLFALFCCIHVESISLTAMQWLTLLKKRIFKVHGVAFVIWAFIRFYYDND